MSDPQDPNVPEEGEPNEEPSPGRPEGNPPQIPADGDDDTE